MIEAEAEMKELSVKHREESRRKDELLYAAKEEIQSEVSRANHQ